MIMGFISTVVLTATVLIFARSLLRIFTNDEQVIAIALQFMWIYAPFYIFFCFTQILPGALRGAGDVKVPTLAFLACFVVVRQIYLYFVTQSVHTVRSVGAGFPITWFLASVVVLIYYLRTDWSSFEKKPEGLL
jgi:Na+-driven multidrug efflux pump